MLEHETQSTAVFVVMRKHTSLKPVLVGLKPEGLRRGYWDFLSRVVFIPRDSAVAIGTF